MKKKKKLPVCYKCEKVGHYKNKCKTKQKVNELNIDEGLKKQLLKIMLNSESETSGSEEEGGQEINEINTSSEEECDSDCECYTCVLGLYVLTNKENTILEIVDKIEDQELKKEIILIT